MTDTSSPESLAAIVADIRKQGDHRTADAISLLEKMLKDQAETHKKEMDELKRELESAAAAARRAAGTL